MLCNCRPSSAGRGDAISPEAAGLFWRKHRLTTPQSLSLNVLDCSTSEVPDSTAAKPETNDDNLTAGVVQSDDVAEALSEDQPYAGMQLAEHSQSADLSSMVGTTAVHAVFQSTAAMQSDTGNSSLPGLHPEQSSTEADCYNAERQQFDASTAIHQPPRLGQSSSRHAASQPRHDLESHEWSSNRCTSSAATSTAKQHPTAMPASDSNTVSTADECDHVTHRRPPQNSVVRHEQPDVQVATHAAKQHQGFDMPGANDNTFPAGVRPDSSSFLQRLARERQPAAIAAHFDVEHMPQSSMSPVPQPIAAHAPQSSVTQSADERPPTPERPTTSSRPSRRRNFVPILAESSVSLYAHLSHTTSTDAANNSRDEARVADRTKAAGFAGTNKLFAPMQDMDSAYMASISAKLALRPSSASAAQTPMSVCPALCWARSMQLPPGILTGAAQQQHLLPKIKKRFNWGFDSPNGFK